MPVADAKATFGKRHVIGTGDEFLQPRSQRPLQAFDLRVATSDDSESRLMLGDLAIEVVDEFDERFSCDDSTAGSIACRG